MTTHAIRVMRLTPEEHNEFSDKVWARRQWEMMALWTIAARRNSKLL
jgi:hypothetical protein